MFKCEVLLSIKRQWQLKEADRDETGWRSRVSFELGGLNTQISKPIPAQALKGSVVEVHIGLCLFGFNRKRSS